MSLYLHLSFFGHVMSPRDPMLVGWSWLVRQVLLSPVIFFARKRLFVCRKIMLPVELNILEGGKIILSGEKIILTGGKIILSVWKIVLTIEKWENNFDRWICHNMSYIRALLFFVCLMFSIPFQYSLDYVCISWTLLSSIVQKEG